MVSYLKTASLLVSSLVVSEVCQLRLLGFFTAIQLGKPLLAVKSADTEFSASPSQLSLILAVFS
jgi:hypothetical protein